MTARATWPFFTLPFGAASLIETTITSPTVAYLRLEPPSTLMQRTCLAPLLSATSSTDSIWIMGILRPAPSPRAPSLVGGVERLAALDHHPALRLRERPALLDDDDVVDLALVLLVVRVVLLPARDELVVLAVPHRARHL